MDVTSVAKLANLTLTQTEAKTFSPQLQETLKTVDLINEIDTSLISPTSQVTGLENVTRPDVIDLSSVLSQNQAISQATQTKNGYIVVPAIFS